MLCVWSVARSYACEFAMNGKVSRGINWNTRNDEVPRGNEKRLGAERKQLDCKEWLGAEKDEW